ncbi:hypothetical protein ACNKHV_17720 [Shigella flexneri]
MADSLDPFRVRTADAFPRRLIGVIVVMIIFARRTKCSSSWSPIDRTTFRGLVPVSGVY